MSYVPAIDSLHKSLLNGLLEAIIDNAILSQNLYFKGGTCAAMLGFLDRFSVDLDFDINETVNPDDIRAELRKIFNKLGLKIESENSKVVNYLLKYKNSAGTRNTMMFDALGSILKNNIYEQQYLSEIDRYANCQTIETMFANKLIAVTERYKKHNKVVGRDLYDIHHFFLRGFDFSKPLIEERKGMEYKKYFQELTVFIKDRFTQTIIDQDINYLLSVERFHQVRKILIPETISFINGALRTS